MSKRIVTVVGARPQFIKAAAVSRVLRAAAGLEEILIHTGQHYDENMSDVFFKELEIPRPDYHLGIGSGSHGAQTGRMLETIERALLETKPALLLVYGDTNSTLAGALAAAKLHIAVAHVEAGLRSFNRRMPEEINRVVTDHLADWLFAPTTGAVQHLKDEGLPDSRVHLSGDVMYDAALYYAAKATRESRILETLSLKPKGYILATIHRAENTDDPSRLAAVFGGLMEAAQAMPVVLPLHPRTRKMLQQAGLLETISRRLRLTEPAGYLDMVMLERNASVVVTDSGGVQKEAFFYRVPCVTLRDETEWVELVELGWNRVVPPHGAAQVADGIRASSAARGAEGSPYGTGDAAQRIVKVLQEA
ncbi:MAG: UDP-N-acetylglucosamine 2-epimerase (non-hydrolyzing) [Planctomycetota bacterium]|nr:UDP-N-acetylglucosamine 2-epimerase (non-hydrolyzing) [Planctomycetota bacterium]